MEDWFFGAGKFQEENKQSLVFGGAKYGIAFINIEVMLV